MLSDAMTVNSIEESAIALRGQVNLSFGWGTTLTNDFLGCAPAGIDGQLKPISLVCKVADADGRRPSSSPTIRTRRSGRRRKSSAIAACSASPE